MACASEPEPGSVRQNAATSSPVAQRVSQRRFWSSVPKSVIPLHPIDWWAPKYTASEASMVPTSPKTRLKSSAEAPKPPYSSGMLSPIIPSSAMPARTSSPKRPSRSSRAVSTVADAQARKESRMAVRLSLSAGASSGNGKTRSSRISPRKTPRVNEGLCSGSARWAVMVRHSESQGLLLYPESGDRAWVRRIDGHRRPHPRRGPRASGCVRVANCPKWPRDQPGLESVGRQ